MSSGAQSYIAIKPADPLNPSAVPPAGGDPAEKINFTDEDMSAKPTYAESNHIRNDRMTQNLTRTTLDIGGGYNYEMHFRSDIGEKMFASVLWSEWEGPIKATPDVHKINIEGAVFTPGSVDFSTATEKPDNLLPVHYVHFEGVSAEGQYILTKTATADVYDINPPTLDEAAPAGATLDSMFVKNGNKYSPWFIERALVDVSQYFTFMGMSANTWALSVPEQGIITAGYQFVGLDSSVSDDAAYPDPGNDYRVPPTTDILSTEDLTLVAIDGVPIGDCNVQTLSLEISNNLTAKKGAGKAGACRVNAHRLSVTGAMSVFFENSDLYNKLMNGEEFSLVFQLTSTGENARTYYMPRCKLSEDAVNVTGIDDDVLENASFTALADNEFNAQIVVFWEM